MTFKVAIIGQGYVGLPLSIATATNGIKTIGIDTDSSKVSKLNHGKSVIEDVSDHEILSVIEKGLYRASSDFSEINGVETIVICVPTPLKAKNEPDMSFVVSAVKSIAKYLKNGTLVVLESTVSPGATRNYVAPLLESESGIKISDFFLAFSPERIDPKNAKWNVKNTPKIVAGLNLASRSKATVFYSKFVDTIVECDTLEIAEAAKLLENTFRLINISFINELSIICQKLGIDIEKVVKGAATKPYGFMAFYPSIGIGGHCIPVDPIYLADAAKSAGASTKFIDLANQVNEEMPGYFVDRAEEKLDGLKNKKVLVIGVSYKSNVADVRETPVEALILGLKNKGAEVFWHDDLVKEWNGEKSVALSNEYDLAILATPHAYLDLTKLGDVPILNTRGSI